MSSIKTVIIQTALRPMAVVASNDDLTFDIQLVADFNEFFATMNTLKIDEKTAIYVNRGPGSYSGIRTGVAYVYGLLHGGLIANQNIKTFTSFDLIRAYTKSKNPIYLKAWPRVPSGKLEESKGYFENNNGEQSYQSYEQIASEVDLFSVGEEQIVNAQQYETTVAIINSQNTYKNLVLKELSADLEPLYINPVHIT